ncbi:MAG: hypothetical protein AAFV77_02815 [Planctomycetota bacterium]
MASRRPSSQAAADALAELLRAPHHVLLRAIDRLEAAMFTIEADASLPAGWFLSTASGYAIDSRGRVDSATAIADAGILIERLSAHAKVTPEELPAGSLDLAQLAAKWGVAERTVLRYRARGLPARSVRSGRTQRLMFTPDAIAAFETSAGATIGKAKSFTRLSDEERERAILRANELQSGGSSASSAARTIAAELGRSHESIRQLLLKRSGSNAGWSTKQRRLALRAHDRCIEPAAIGSRLGRKTTATRRMIDAQRLARLRGLDLPETEPEHNDIIEIPVGAPGPTLLADLVAEMRDSTTPDRALERAITAAACTLTVRAARTIAQTRAAHLRSEPIDAAETDLLWAARLRVEALRPLLSIVLRSIEARLGGEIETLPSRAAATKLQLAIAAAAEAAHRYDPARGGRLSAAVTLAVDHAMADTQAPASSSTTARRTFAQARIEDWTHRVSPWQSFLDTPHALRAGLPALAPEQRALLEARFGLGERPRTLDALAERFGIHRPWVARRVREATREAMRVGRRASRPDSIAP